MHYHMFPQEIQDLQEELSHHPALMQQLAALPPDADLADKMAEVCAFCGMVLDGVYSEQEVLKLCEIAVGKLRKAREELVLDIMKPVTPTSH